MEHEHDNDGVISPTNDAIVILYDYKLVNLVLDESIWIVYYGTTLMLGFYV